VKGQLEMGPVLLSSSLPTELKIVGSNSITLAKNNEELGITMVFRKKTFLENL
jgi:hypothetical protein